MNMKKKCVGVLSGLFLLTTCIALPVSLSASAEELGSFASENLQMTEGAATRTLSPYGLKFQATFTTEEAPEGNYGMLIVPYDYFAKAEVEIAETTDYVTAFSTAYTEGKITYAPIIVEGLQAKTGENGLCIEHSIVELREGNFDRPFFGVAFEKVGEEYQYAPFNNNVRSIMQVASAALNKHHTTTGGKYGEAELSELNKFVSTGISNAHGNGFEYAISGDGATGVGYTTALSVNTGLIANWSSNNEEVATVDKNGVVTGVSEGTATITAENYIGGEKKTATLEVTVSEAQTSTLTFADLGMANQQAFTSHWVDNITYSISGSTNIAKYYDDGTGRWYKNDTMKIVPDAGYKILKATIESSGKGADTSIGDATYYSSSTADFAFAEGTKTQTLDLIPKVGCSALDLTNVLKARRMLNISVVYVLDGNDFVQPQEKTLAELATMTEGWVTGDYSGEAYEVTGVITALDEVTGAMTITDGTTSVNVTNTFGADGKVHYASVPEGEKPVLGNEVTLIAPVQKTEEGFQLLFARMQSYRVVAVADSVKVAATKAEIESLEILETTATLPVVGETYGEVVISWAASVGEETSTIIEVDAEGNVTVNKPMEKAEVTLTATISCGDATDSVEYTVTVLGTALAKEATYTFEDYPEGTANKTETHVLDAGLTVTVQKCHFTTELRIYSSSTNNGNAVFASTRAIEKIVFNAGYKTDTLNVYGLEEDGETWTLIEGVAIESPKTTSYSNYTLTIANPKYKQIKLDVAGTNQIRIKSMTITYVN